MKRFHVHVSVEDFEASIRFYATVFGGPPTVRKPDCVKWMVEDPRVDFAISSRGAPRSPEVEGGVLRARARGGAGAIPAPVVPQRRGLRPVPC